MLKTVFIALILLYLLVLFLSYWHQDKLLFFPKKFEKDFNFHLSEDDKELFLKTNDGEIINCIYATKPGNKKVMLYFHGNGTSLDQWKSVADIILPHGVNLMMIDYRGYGKSTGKFSEDGFYTDAETAYNFLTANGYNDSTIYFYGRSLGSGVAVEMTLRHKVCGLILEAPYSSVKDVAQQQHPYLLPKLLLKYDFNNLKKASAIQSPLLIIHGRLDELIPVKQAEQVFASAKCQKQICMVPDGSHNNLSAFDEYHRALSEFLDR